MRTWYPKPLRTHWVRLIHIKGKPYRECTNCHDKWKVADYNYKWLEMQPCPAKRFR